MELIEQIAERLESLERLATRAVVCTSLLHEVDDLRHRVLLNRFVLHICRCVVYREYNRAEARIPQHQRQPANLGTFRQLANRRVPRIHLNELLAHFELYFS